MDDTPQPVAAEALAGLYCGVAHAQRAVDDGGKGRVRLPTVVLIWAFTLGALYMLFSPLVTRLLAMLNETVPGL